MSLNNDAPLMHFSPLFGALLIMIVQIVEF